MGELEVKVENDVVKHSMRKVFKELETKAKLNESIEACSEDKELYREEEKLEETEKELVTDDQSKTLICDMPKTLLCEDSLAYGEPKILTYTLPKIVYSDN